MPPSKPSQGYVERFYETHRAELLGEKAVTEKKMFGTTALCTHGKVFMFPWKESLVLKLPEERVNKLLASKSGELFDPGHGRKSKTWVAVFPSAKRQWPQLIAAARQFVEG
jgi:hypothetical protein